MLPEAFAKRRARIAQELDGTLVVATHPVTTYSNDVEHVFRPHSDFWYLTGFAEPDSVLVLQPSGESTLFLRPRKPEAEIWTGRRLGVDAAPDALGVDKALPIDELATLPDMLEGDVVAITGHHEAHHYVEGAMPEDGAPLLAKHRVIKDQDEIALMQKAADIGCDAMRMAAAGIAPGVTEYQIEAELLHAYKAAGSTGPGYPPIVGTGANAAVLHYIENRDTVKDGDMVLIDAGCEWGYYNSDITRTYAVGDVPALHRELHGVVLAAQEAAIAQVKPGNTIRHPHEAAARVLAQGLSDLGVLDADPEKILKSQLRNHFMHGTSHFLGLDVHDVGHVKHGNEARKLEPGMVITVEPGLYFNSDFAPSKIEGLGIRIEDDILVTEDGHRNLTADLDRSMEVPA